MPRSDNPYVCKLERIPSEARCELIFRLIYDGPLPAENRSRGLGDVKSEIRRQFSPQLEELWRTNGELKVLGGAPAKYHTSREIYRIFGVEAIAEAYQVGDVRFVPLVRKTNNMLCRLDISVLMRQPPFHSTFTAGDLDNRIKTLIDGLTRPSQVGAHKGNPGETLYCLMDDDDRIAEFSVRCDQLLAPRRDDQVERDVVALITVEVLNTHGEVVTTASLRGRKTAPSR